jgi:hypothetical protein
MESFENFIRLDCTNLSWFYLNVQLIGWIKLQKYIEINFWLHVSFWIFLCFVGWWTIITSMVVQQPHNGKKIDILFIYIHPWPIWLNQFFFVTYLDWNLSPWLPYKLLQKKLYLWNIQSKCKTNKILSKNPMHWLVPSNGRFVKSVCHHDYKMLFNHSTCLHRTFKHFQKHFHCLCSLGRIGILHIVNYHH